MSKDKKGVYTGKIEKDADGNYFCGEYLLDYQYTEKNFKIGDEVNLKTVIENPSDKSYDKYPKNHVISFWPTIKNNETGSHYFGKC